MRRQFSVILLLIALGGAFASGRDGDQKESDTIIALERGALDRWGHGDPGGYLELYARNVTYFDPGRDARINGADAMRQALEPIRGLIKIDRYEMIAPRVDRKGDMAVLSYNLVTDGRGPDGGLVVRRWNSTAVYVRNDGRWKILHSHWSFTKPDVRQGSVQ